MHHLIDLAKRKYLGFIEVLNDKGMNVVHIDNAYYVFTEFEPANPTIGTEYITLKGQDITALVENAIEKSGYTAQVQNELMLLIGREPIRIREYSSKEPWVKYVALT